MLVLLWRKRLFLVQVWKIISNVNSHWLFNGEFLNLLITVLFDRFLSYVQEKAKPYFNISKKKELHVFLDWNRNLLNLEASTTYYFDLWDVAIYKI